MDIWPILRKGNYHSSLPEKENPSATSLRSLILSGADISPYIPHEALSVFQGAVPHATEFAEKSILSRLRTMTDEEFEALPYGSEGLWRKLMHASREYATLEEIIAATKSKRYTRTRLDRMVLCAFLGITQDMLNAPAPYVRALGFNDRGREILKLFRETGDFPNIGQVMNNPYQALENRCTDLYGLFAKKPESPGKEEQYRVYCHKNA
jgi:predicted nucleotidyltransferase